MDNQPEVTVVMAVYNSEASVGGAIESVQRQTYDNWRLICVNDGSSDNSLEVIRRYSAQDKRITVISKENGGPASARAEAYKITDTPYVIYLDSDDAFSEDLLMNTVNMAKKTDADSVAPNFISQHGNGTFSDWNKDNRLESGMTMTGLEAFRRLFICPSMHGCNLWRTDLVKKFAVGENASYRSLNADEYIQRHLFLNCRTVAISGGEYIYNFNSESITKKFSKKHVGYLITCRKYFDLIDQYNIDNDTASIIREYYFRHVIHLQTRLFRDGRDLSKSERVEIQSELKKAYMEAMKYKNDIRFAEKRHSWLYRLMSTSGYPVFLLTCRISARK